MSESSEIRQFKYGHGNDAEHQRHEADYRLLLERHTSISRRTEHRSDGIRAWTTSTDPRVAQILQRHARDMKQRFSKGRAIRSWDVLFQRLYEYRDVVHVHLTMLPDGVYAELSSVDPSVVPYIYAHGRTLVNWVRSGFPAAKEASPLPPL